MKSTSIFILASVIIFSVAYTLSSYADTYTKKELPMEQTDIRKDEKTIFDFTVKSLDGKELNFADFKGKKLLIVNTASKCGYTKQYEGLQELHEKMEEKVTIIGFPANNFGGQEPGTNDEIKSFCKKNYGVTFPMAAKVSVKGGDQHELFTWLCAQENADFTGDIRWNFEKFLIDENGKLIHRFRSGTEPMSEEITSKL